MSVESVTSDKQPPTTTTPTTTTAMTTTTTAAAAVTSSSSATATAKKEEGDEAIISMSVAGEVTDASIMEVGRSRPQFQYSRDELMVIKDMRLSKRRPAVLDNAYNNSRGVWDPERWHSDRKRSDTPPKEERTGRSDQITENHSKRRSNGDPRDRIRKEQDGIVLSPQRRSFNSGCYVNVNQPPNRRPESPIGKTEVSHREPVRRIGSGRILARDIWDFRSENEKIESERADYGFRSGTAAGGPLRDRDNRDNRDGKERDRERDMRERERDRDSLRERDERFERRSFGRDYGDRGERERDRGDRGGSERNNERNSHQTDRDKDRGREKRFSNDRRRTYSDNRDSMDEPEWFSSGPTSQHDTIELRGFEDIPEEKAVSNSGSSKNKKQTPAQKKRNKKNAVEKDDKPNENSAGPKGRSTPTVMDQPLNAVPAPHSPISEQTEQSSSIQSKENDISESTVTDPTTSESTENSSANQNQEDSHPDFNLDDFLKAETFPGVSGLLTNGVGTNSGTGSRFSQWFKRESPIQQADSRRASIQDELLNNLLNDINEPNIQIPSVTESNAYFAPISPANTTNNANSATNGVKLLEMLHRGNKPSQNGQGDASNTAISMKNCSIKDLEIGGKVHSLEELEARMRGGAPPPATSTDTPHVNKTEEDLSAFKKLLAQMNGGQAVPAANGPITQKQPVTLMQLLNSQLKTQQQPSIPHQQPSTEPIHTTTFNHVGPLGPAQHPHQAQMQHENLMKVLQIQQQQQQQQQQQKQRHSDMLSMMMGNQRMLGVSPVPAEMQMMINNIPSSQELLQRPEAQAIIQGLQQGEITRQHLMQQLQNPAMQHRHREMLVNILKMYGGTTPRTISPHPHPAPPTHQDHMLQQMLYQQQQQRIPSPMSNAYCPPPIISSNLPASPSTLTVQHPVIPHRVPSPREIVMHTQSIMQSALIKKKLEEQRENFRKRQDQQQQQQQVQQQQQLRASSPVINSPAKQTASPLAFTPTSVLRKMTADKEPDGNGSDPSKLSTQTQASQMQQMQSAVQLLTQGALSRHTALRPQSVPSTWSNSSQLKQHPGRPIVKGGNNGNTSSNQFQYNTANVEFQQHQHRTVANVYGNPARSKHTMTTSLPHHNVPQYNPVVQNSIINPRSNPINTQMKAQQVPAHLASMQQSPHGTASIQQQQPPQQRTVNTPMQLVMNQNYNSNRTDGRAMRSQQLNMTVGRQPSPGLGFVGSNGGDLSPTSNQLARWFSPELLAQARAGKLPELGQTNVLSLEELERLQHASTIVHN
ncbi:eukaryotic translation initiation factor 4E transporter-like isoform X2 [Nylanderia fulva]|uniref:eukaryotic translation initiation factor 4E transporter-like isoform X2 n=1 Tax=Nylanderia fulva TaxID=613905 RepID=UPI0010FBB049|nr:eukaryotic translation initiation factor 4E transporter-like isoform X2 [Nylanderia fulva]